MKIHEALKYAINLLKASNSPNLDAEIILAHVLNVDRTWIFVNFTSTITTNQEGLFLELISKRMEGMPIAYLTKTKDFWKSSFMVNKHTLIPRPDSETTIEAFCATYKNKEISLNVADLGTGTGCLLISIANEYKNIYGYGVEKMQQTFFIAKKNILHNKLNNRVKLFYNNWNNVNIKINFDTIISNPPYIQKGEIKELSKEVSKYEPKSALDGGITGLEAYEEIFHFSLRYLKKNGLLFLEIGRYQYKQVYLMGVKKGLIFHETFRDLSGVKRVMVFKKVRKYE